MFDHRAGCSQKKAARKLDTTQQYISKILKTKKNIEIYKRKKVPAQNSAQEAKKRPYCKKLLQKYKSYQFIQDDESYFTLSHSTLAGNDIFYSSNKNQTPELVSYIRKAKYEKKIMIWVAISPRGISQVYFVPSKMAVNGEVYLKECIKKRLIPFINKYHRDTQTVFWPDLAPAHYYGPVLNHLRQQNVEFVPKAENPPAVPEARSIEDFWADLKRLVYQGGWTAKNIPQLKQRIKNCLRIMDPNVAMARASETHARLRKIGNSRS